MMIKDFDAFIACSTVFRLLLNIYFANITITVSKIERMSHAYYAAYDLCVMRET